MSVTDEEREIYNLMKNAPDFHNLPLPKHWYAAFDIPFPQATTIKDFIKSGYTMACMYAPKDLPPIIINKPQQDGKLVDLVITEPIPVEVVSKPFELPEGEMFPIVLPSLEEKSTKQNPSDEQQDASQDDIHTQEEQASQSPCKHPA